MKRSVLVSHLLLLTTAAQAAGPPAGRGYNKPDQVNVPVGMLMPDVTGSIHSLAIRFFEKCTIPPGTAPDCNLNGIPDECDITLGTSKDVNENGVPDECDPCPVIDLARLRAVPAWDIEFTRSTTNSASGGGGITVPSRPGLTGFSLDYQSNYVYSFRVTVAGDCTSSGVDSTPWPCVPLLSPENPGEVRLEREELLDRWELNYAAGGGCCIPQTPQATTESQEVRTTITSGVVSLDGTPAQFVRGGFGIDTSVCPPRAYGNVVAFPGFPGRQTSSSCRSCGYNGVPAGCRTNDRELSGSIHHNMFLEFGPFYEEDTWVTDVPVRMENGRFVMRGQGVFINLNSPCIDDPIYCGLSYSFVCSQTNVVGARTQYVSVVIREHNAPAPPLAIHSVEFTQGIQVLQPLALLKADLAGDGSPPVPIVAGKPAVMRVYFDEVTEPTSFTLNVGGGEIAASRTGILRPACAPEDQRRQASACFAQDFYFTPPEGPWAVTLRLEDGNGVEQESHVLHLTSKKSDAIVLKAVTVCDTVDAAGNWHCASGSTLQLLVGLLKKIAPTDEVVVINTGHQVKGRVTADMNGDLDLDDCIDDNANGIDDLGDRCEADKWFGLVAYALHELHSISEPLDGVPGVATLYYGMVRPGVPGGTLGIALLSGMGGASETSVPMIGLQLAPWVVAHETAHMLGRDHTNTNVPVVGVGSPGCWLGTPVGVLTWPYADNWIQSGLPPGVIEIGFDVQARTVLDPRITFDVMGYCAGSNWISPHTTLGLLEVLAPSGTAATATAAALGQVGSYWRVSGTIEDGAAAINPIFTLETQGSTDDGSGTHRIEVLGVGDNVLFTRFFTPEHPHISPGPYEPAPEGTPFFSEFIPVQANAVGIVVKDPNGAPLAQIALGGTAPTVNITFPTGGELLQDPETATWTVADADSANQMFQVHYSADGGTTWRSLTSATSALSLVVDFSELPGSAGQSLLRVIASDGVNTGMAVSNSFSVGKKHPTAEIIFPSTDASFALGTLVLLQATGFDADDGLLTGSALQWSSDVDGSLGSSVDRPVYSRSRGKHLITLTVTDGDGNMATDQVTVFVFDQPTADGDFDGDVDLVDFGPVSRCLAGPRTTPSAPACRAFDFDADGDVDEADFAVFQNCVSGTDAPADPKCAR